MKKCRDIELFSCFEISLADGIGLHFAPQLAAADLEQSGGLLFPPRGRLQGLDNGLALQGLQGTKRTLPPGQNGGHFPAGPGRFQAGQMSIRNERPLAEDKTVFQHVLQFPDIARPGVPAEKPHHLGVHPPDALVKFPV